MCTLPDCLGRAAAGLARPVDSPARRTVWGRRWAIFSTDERNSSQRRTPVRQVDSARIRPAIQNR